MLGKVLSGEPSVVLGALKTAGFGDGSVLQPKGSFWDDSTKEQTVITTKQLTHAFYIQPPRLQTVLHCIHPLLGGSFS